MTPVPPEGRRPSEPAAMGGLDPSRPARRASRRPERTAAFALAFSTLISGTVAGQERPVLRAHRATGVVLDGLVAEPAWLAADSIANLTQIEPREGEAPSARTVVRVLADSRDLNVAVVAHDPRPEGIVSFSKARDSELRGQDHVQIVLDTYLDGRSGYTFSVNPGGARFDALVGRVGERSNSNWDGVWEAATRVGEGGWSAEIRIPVRSLGFDASLREWGFNVQRRIERLQETDRWASPELDYAVTQTSRAGRLTGLPGFELGTGLTVTPSVVGGVGVPEPGAPTDVELEPSLDVTQRVGANLLLSGTANTDFAETEVDTRQTNLTRFPLFFPEKRAFFLEGADIFDFGFLLGEDVIPFFSRRVGLVEGEEVPLQAGVKLNGRVGDTNLGGLAVRTGGESGLTQATEMGVVRVARNVLEQSTAGVLATLGDPLGRGDAWLAGTDSPTGPPPSSATRASRPGSGGSSWAGTDCRTATAPRWASAWTTRTTSGTSASPTSGWARRSSHRWGSFPAGASTSSIPS